MSEYAEWLNASRCSAALPQMGRMRGLRMKCGNMDQHRWVQSVIKEMWHKDALVCWLTSISIMRHVFLLCVLLLPYKHVLKMMTMYLLFQGNEQRVCPASREMPWIHKFKTIQMKWVGTDELCLVFHLKQLDNHHCNPPYTRNALVYRALIASAWKEPFKHISCCSNNVWNCLT